MLVLPVVNKVLLAHSYAHLFMYYLCLLPYHNNRVVVTETVWPTKPKILIFTIWRFTDVY